MEETLLVLKINNKYNNLIRNTDNDNLWHRRLGHFYHKDLSKFIKEHTTSHNSNDNNLYYLWNS